MEQHREKPVDDHVLTTPIWVMVLRGFQFLVSVIILALAADIIHDAYLDQIGFAVASVCHRTFLSSPTTIRTERASRP